MLNLWRERQIVFQQWLHRFTFPTTMLGRFQFLTNLVNTCFLLLLACLFTLILVDVPCHLIVILMLISLMTSDIEHLFTCLLAICILFFWEKYILKSYAHFKIGLLVFLLLSYKSSYIFWVLQSYQINYL